MKNVEKVELENCTLDLESLNKKTRESSLILQIKEYDYKKV